MQMSVQVPLHDYEHCIKFSKSRYKIYRFFLNTKIITGHSLHIVRLSEYLLEHRVLPNKARVLKGKSSDGLVVNYIILIL